MSRLVDSGILEQLKLAKHESDELTDPREMSAEVGFI